ncbi:MAG: hypothetical protein ACLP3R_06335 [Candidatus Korobacteraceae bacterium]
MNKLLAWIDSIDPRKVGMIGCAFTVLAGLISGGQIDLHNMVPVASIPYIVAWSKAISIIVPALVGGHSALDLFGKNPMTNNPVVKTVIACLIAAVAMSFLSMPASAAPLPKARPAAVAAATPVTPASPTKKQLTTTQVQQNPILLIQQFSAQDLQNALADANAQTPPDTVGAACWSALLVVVNSPINNPLPTAPGAFLLVQKGRDLQTMLANLQSPTGPLSTIQTACAPLILSAENTLVQLGIITGGVAVVGASGGTALPAFPLLTQLLAILPK